MIKINSRIYTQELEIPQVIFFALVNTHTNNTNPGPSPSMLEPGIISIEERCLTTDQPVKFPNFVMENSNFNDMS